MPTLPLYPAALPSPVEAPWATVTLASEGPGRGAIVSICLPLNRYAEPAPDGGAPKRSRSYEYSTLGSGNLGLSSGTKFLPKNLVEPDPPLDTTLAEEPPWVTVNGTTARPIGHRDCSGTGAFPFVARFEANGTRSRLDYRLYRELGFDRFLIVGFFESGERASQ